MTSYYLVIPGNTSSILDNLIKGFVAGAGEPAGVIKVPEDLPNLQHQKVVFAVQLDQIGQSQGMNSILSTLYDRGKDALHGGQAVILVVSPSELYTKSYTQNLIFLLNRLGCSFPGHPLIEVVDGYLNFRTWQKTLQLPLEDIPRKLDRKSVV